MKKLFGVFICLFFSVILAACGGGSSPEAAAKKYVQAVYNGDADTVRSIWNKKIKKTLICTICYQGK